MTRRQIAEAGVGDDAEVGQPIGASIDLSQRDSADVAIYKRNGTTRSQAGDDADGAGAAAEVENAVAGPNLRHFRQGACPVIHSAVSEYAGAGGEDE